MMRRLALWLIVLAGLALGLALALAVNGRMAHLRALALPLPEWGAAIDDSAGLMQGSARLGSVDLGWRLAGLGRAGPVWQMRLSGTGLALQAPAVLVRPGEGARGPVLALSPVAGQVDSGALPGWPQARLEPTRGGLRLDLRHGQVTALEIEGLARDVMFEGSALGSGRFVLRHAPGEDWHLVATLRDTAATDAGTIHAELRIDRAAGSAALALVPQDPDVPSGGLPPEGTLRALPLPAALAR